MGFKEFLFRGNLVQLAVAVIIGTAFANVVAALSKGLITPLLGIFGGQPEFSKLHFTVNGSQFLYGLFVDALIAFLITALVLYYLVVVPSDWLLSKINKAEESNQRPCPECCSKIDKNAKKCPNCTSAVIPIEDPPEAKAGSETA